MKTRRDVLASLLGTGAVVASSSAMRAAQNARGVQPAPAVVPVSPSGFDPWVEVRAAHVRHNVEEISRRTGGRPILGVIKNDGYGCGVVAIGRELETQSAVDGVAVIKLQEAVRLREGGIRKPVLLMGPIAPPELAELAARDIMPMVYTPMGDALDRLAARRQRPLPIHVCVDTGIGRVGVPHRDAAALIHDLAGRRSVSIAGVMMTFAEDPEFDREQLRRFEGLCRELGSAGIALGRRHAASSFALFQRPDAFLDMVRPGMAIYGVYSELPFRSLEVMDLRPVLSLKARVAYVKQLPAGDSAGYNRAYLARQPVWIATLPVGHADGWPRAAAKGARVSINGALYPVIASVSASHTIVEIGAEPRVRVGDVATLFGWEPGARPEDVSAACGASVYDLLMHLNPLLPRRLV